MSNLPPGELVVRLAPDVLVDDGGHLIVGGAPLRLMRLSRRGAGEVLRWRHGGAIGASEDNRRLAARMLDAGILLVDPRPEPSRPAGAVTVAVPVKDRPEELAR